MLNVICAGGWMSPHLSEGWRRLGCGVEEFFYGTHMGKAWDRAGYQQNHLTNQRLIQTASSLRNEGRLDLVFCMIYDDVLEPGTAQALRKLGVPLINYHVDLVGQWYRILQTGRYFDLVACAHEDYWSALEKAGMRLHYMPMAANPPTDPEPLHHSDPFAGVLYLGSPWTYRKRVLAQVAAAGVPLAIYGNNWLKRRPDTSTSRYWRKDIHDAWNYLWPRLREENWGSLLETIGRRFRKSSFESGGGADVPASVIRGRYNPEDFCGLVRGAAINLGFTHFRGEPGTLTERRQVRLREFEIPIAGGFYLTQDCSQLRSLYNVGQHLETWNTVGELLEKMRHYLAQPREREKVAGEGERHARLHHTWEVRFRSLLERLGVRAPVHPCEATA